MENIEIEYKVMISESSFNKLHDFLGNNHRTYNQINYYYDDSKMSLRKLGLSLRIRFYENNQKYLVTLKEKKEIGHKEYEEYIKANSLSLISNEITSHIPFDISYLHEVCKLKTLRYEYDIDGTKFCLDKSEYYGITDYEVECEAGSMEKAISVIENILKVNNINYNVSKKTKFARALKKSRNNIKTMECFICHNKLNYTESINVITCNCKKCGEYAFEKNFMTAYDFYFSYNKEALPKMEKFLKKYIKKHHICFIDDYDTSLVNGYELKEFRDILNMAGFELIHNNTIDSNWED